MNIGVRNYAQDTSNCSFALYMLCFTALAFLSEHEAEIRKFSIRFWKGEIEFLDKPISNNLVEDWNNRLNMLSFMSSSKVLEVHSYNTKTAGQS